MKTSLFIILICILAGCTNRPLRVSESELSILDLTKNYPKRELAINEIAEVEYVPLETTDSSVIATGIMTNISEKYIITTDVFGPVFIFDRKGKHLRTLHARGQGPEEYNMIYAFAVDFPEEEFYVTDYKSKRIQVYDFTGKWKRTLKISKELFYDCLFNYNEQYLIGVNEFYDTPNFDNLPMNKTPYHLLDKKTSTHKPVPIIIDNWISKTLERKAVKVGENTTIMETTALSLIPRLWANSYDFFISEFSKDTLYSFKNGQLLPLAIRYPSVESCDIPVVIAPIFYTDNYLLFKPVTLRLDKDYKYAPYDEAPLLLWNRKTDEIQHVTRLYDSNRGKYIKSNMHNERSEQPNFFMTKMKAFQLCEEYEAGKLKGKLKEVASKLKEDDNDVIAIYKLK